MASARVIVGRSPSGTFATIRPIAKLSASWSGSPAASPIGRNASPTGDRDEGDQPGDAPDLRSSGLGSASTRSVRAAMRPSSRLHARREHERLRVAADAGRAAEDEVARLDQRPGASPGLGRAQHRLRLARQRREVDLERSRRAAARRPRSGRPPRPAARRPGRARARRRRAAGRPDVPPPVVAGSPGAPRPPSRPAAPGRTRRPRSGGSLRGRRPRSRAARRPNASPAATQRSRASG